MADLTCFITYKKRSIEPLDVIAAGLTNLIFVSDNLEEVMESQRY